MQQILTPFQLNVIDSVAQAGEQSLTGLRSIVGRILNSDERKQLDELIEMGLVVARGKTTYRLTHHGFWLSLASFLQGGWGQVGRRPLFDHGQLENIRSKLLDPSMARWYGPLKGMEREICCSPYATQVYPLLPAEGQAQLLSCWAEYEHQTGFICFNWAALAAQSRDATVQALAEVAGYEQGVLLGRTIPVYVDSADELVTLLTQGGEGPLEHALVNALTRWRLRVKSKSGFFPGNLTLVWLGLMRLAKADLTPWLKQLRTWSKKQDPWLKEAVDFLANGAMTSSLKVLEQLPELFNVPKNTRLACGELWVCLCELLFCQDQEAVGAALRKLPLSKVLDKPREGLLHRLCLDLIAYLAAMPTQLPLFGLVHRAAPWESWLEMLQPATSKAAVQERLVWQLSAHPCKLEARLQKISAKGGWTSGRLLDHWSVENLPEILLHELDSQILVSQRRRGYYNDQPTLATLKLLGNHPHLQTTQGEPLSLQFTSPLLLLEETSDGWQASLQPPMTAQNQDGYEISEIAPDWWQVIGLPAEVERVIDGMARVPQLPAEALPRLQETLNRCAGLDWHSPHSALISHTRITPWPGTHCALLNLQEGEARLQLCTIHENSGAWHHQVLGKGTAFIRDNSTAHHYWQRDIEAEKALARQLRKALGQPRGESWRYVGSDAMTLIETLPAILEPLGAELHWHSASQRITALGTEALRLNITSKEAWFQVEGGLQVDNQRVLELRQLLRGLKSGQRFLTLDDQTRVMMSKALQEQMTLLSALLDDKQELELKLAYPLLRLLEQSPIEGDAGWQALATEWQRQAECPAALMAPLREYQKHGVQWMANLASHRFGACLADDMGLGKTIQALTLLRLRQQAGPALVVVPTSLLGNWREEASRFAPELNVIVLNEQSDREEALGGLKAGDLLLTTYGLLPSHPALAAQHWATLVADEAQQIKNAGTVRAKALFALAGDFRLALSGTPVENHLGELWSLFNFINPGLLGSQARFKQRFGKAASDPVHLAQLRAVISPFVLRRLKREVLTELPEKTEIVHRVRLSKAEQSLYEASRREAVSRMQSGEGSALMEMLSQLTRLRQICCSPALLVSDWKQEQSKLDAAMTLVRDSIDNGHRILVFSQFVGLLNLLCSRLEQAHFDYCYLDGQCSVSQRQQAVRRFKHEPVPLFLISLKAGGTGLNLTEADTVIHLDPWWNPAVEDQASDRVHRIGQTEPVTVYRLVCEQTVEEKIVALHAQKRELAEGVLGGQQEVAGLDAELLRSLLQP
ncbi:ATP-dependent helicase HepA [compost metagenome]